MTSPVPAAQANMGQPIARLEARAKVTGAARYASDMPLANPAYAVLVTSTIAKGRIVAIDETAARAVPGVLHILTHRNRPPLQPVKHFFEGGSALTKVPPLAGPEIAHEGQIVAMVTAEGFEAATEAAQRLVVRYEREAPAASFGDSGTVEQRTVEVIPMRKDVTLGDAASALRRP
jgi:xanthine dehydrogenase YagR molybdenum-binding subunit